MSRIVLGAAQVVGSVLVVRGFSDANDYGVFSYYAWLAGVLSTLGVLALPTALTKLTSELRGNDNRGEALALTRWLLLVLLSFNGLIALLLLGFAWYSAPPVRYYLLIVALSIMFHVLVRVSSSLLWGHERYRPIAMATSLAGLGQFICIAIAFALGWGVTGYLVAVVLSMNIIMPVVLFSSRWRTSLWQIVRHSRWPTRDTLKRYRDFAAPASFIMLFDTIVWQRSEIFFLERFSTSAQIGYYSLAFSIYIIFVGLGNALVNGYLPAISREYGAGRWDTVRSKFAEAALLACVYALPLCLGGWVTLPVLVELLYGEAMLPMVTSGRILLSGLVPAAWAAVLSLTIAAINRIQVQIKVGVVMAFVNIGLDLWLIPRYGALGAAISNTTTQLSYVLWLFFIARQIFQAHLPWRDISLVVVLAIFTAFLLPWQLLQWQTNIWGLLIAVALAVPLYVMVLLYSGIISRLGISVPQGLRRWQRNTSRNSKPDSRQESDSENSPDSNRDSNRDK